MSKKVDWDAIKQHLKEHKNVEFTATELANHLSLDKRGTRKYLDNLEKEGEVQSQHISKEKFFALLEPTEPEPCPWFDELIYKIRRRLRKLW